MEISAIKLSEPEFCQWPDKLNSKIIPRVSKESCRLANTLILVLCKPDERTSWYACSWEIINGSWFELLHLQ